MAQTTSIGRRIFAGLAAISLLLFVSVCVLWIAAAFRPRWRVKFVWIDRGTTIISTNTAIGWSAQGVYRARVNDEFTFPDVQSAEPVKQAFTQVTPAGTPHVVIVANPNAGIVLYKPGQPLAGVANNHVFKQTFTTFPEYAAWFAALPITYLLNRLWHKLRPNALKGDISNYTH